MGQSLSGHPDDASDDGQRSRSDSEPDSEPNPPDVSKSPPVDAAAAASSAHDNPSSFRDPSQGADASITVCVNAFVYSYDGARDLFQLVSDKQHIVEVVDAHSSAPEDATKAAACGVDNSHRFFIVIRKSVDGVMIPPALGICSGVSLNFNDKDQRIRFAMPVDQSATAGSTKFLQYAVFVPDFECYKRLKDATWAANLVANDVTSKEAQDFLAVLTAISESCNPTTSEQRDPAAAPASPERRDPSAAPPRSAGSRDVSRSVYPRYSMQTPVVRDTDFTATGVVEMYGSDRFLAPGKEANRFVVFGSGDDMQTVSMETGFDAAVAAGSSSVAGLTRQSAPETRGVFGWCDAERGVVSLVRGLGTDGAGDAGARLAGVATTFEASRSAGGRKDDLVYVVGQKGFFAAADRRTQRLTESATKVRANRVMTHEFTAFTVTTDGGIIAGTAAGNVTFYRRLPTGKPRATTTLRLLPGHAVTGLDASPCGRWVVATQSIAVFIINAGDPTGQETEDSRQQSACEKTLPADAVVRQRRLHLLKMSENHAKVFGIRPFLRARFSNESVSAPGSSGAVAERGETTVGSKVSSGQADSLVEKERGILRRSAREGAPAYIIAPIGDCLVQWYLPDVLMGRREMYEVFAVSHRGGRPRALIDARFATSDGQHSRGKGTRVMVAGERIVGRVDEASGDGSSYAGHEPVFGKTA
eukprot:TRINITY_DN58438_c0_g1_i1.p1 TRINITY_DN58438_c0_g1~~TRINITY_DN58438_c0_g1_i1.p1  ORF type:complete len:701 (+),score=73.18 TRINITY_DN58438_c0_g1_i1:154-2256(+)